jgi:hypothetical protein
VSSRRMQRMPSECGRLVLRKYRASRACHAPRAHLFVTFRQQLSVKGVLLSIRCIGIEQSVNVLRVVGI